MKIGDQFAVVVEGLTVGYAEVENMEGDQALLFIPATRVLVGVRHSLADIEAPAPTTSRQVELENTSISGGVVDAPEVNPATTSAQPAQVAAPVAEAPKVEVQNPAEQEAMQAATTEISVEAAAPDVAPAAAPSPAESGGTSE